MSRDDLLSRIQERARLHGRNESRRVVGAVVTTLSEFASERALRELIARMPPELRSTPVAAAPAGRSARETACHCFVRLLATRLNIEEPDAAFYARVTFEELNVHCGGAGPALLAPALPTDLRSLLCAGAAAAEAARPRTLVTTIPAPQPAVARRPVGRPA